MDALTQGLIGAVSAQLGFRQKIGRDASVVAFITAMLPDADVLVSPALRLAGLDPSDMVELRIHRGVTHSLAMIPLYCLALAGAWCWLRRKWLQAPALEDDATTQPKTEPLAKPPPYCRPSYWWLYACVLVAVLTHPLLDTCTAYGTQLFAPFTNKRYATDNVAIVDLIYSPLLLLTLVACYVVRKVVRNPKAVTITLVIGWGGFLLTSGYLLAGRHLHNVAVEKGIAAASDNGLIQGRHELLTADAYPSIGSIFLWRTVLQTDDQWMAFRIHHFAPAGAAVRFSTADKQANEWISRAMELEDVKTFRWFAMDRVRAVYGRQNGLHVVEFIDMRYARDSDSVEGLWAFRVEFDAQTGQVVSDGFFHHGGTTDRNEMIGRAWRDMWNP